jgi:hypothetical protein
MTINMDSLKERIYMTAWDGHLSISKFVTHQIKPIIILKMDFEKAFDKVEYNAIISMLADTSQTYL